MSLRSFTRLTAVGLAVIAAMAGAALVITTAYLHGLVNEIDFNLESVHAAENIQMNLLWHGRTAYLAEITGEASYRIEAEKAEANLHHWARAAHIYAEEGHEAQLLSSLEGQIDRYLGEYRRLAQQGAPPLQAYTSATPFLMSAYGAAEELVQINLEQSNEAQHTAEFWDRVADFSGLAVTGILFTGVAVLLLAARSQIVRPLTEVQAAIARYGSGDTAVRCPERGPAEIRETAHVFNDMAESLEQHRQKRLEFLAGVAHDLRNPLSAIAMGVETISIDGGASRGEMVSTLSLVRRQVDLLVRMISDLLDATRVEAGQLELHPAVHDLRDLARHATELFRHLSSRHQLLERMAEDPVAVHCDAVRLEQVVNNLISNAIKYSPEGGTVEIGVKRAGDQAVLSVSDHGIGIAPEEQEEIFEPFHRGRASREHIPGVGLGLAVSRRIIEAHGGSIEVRSAPGEGSVFTVRLALG